MVGLGKGAVVPHSHTRVRLIRTISAFFSSIVTETTTVVSVRDTLRAAEFLARANQRHIPGKSPIWDTWRCQILENSIAHVAGNVARNARLGTRLTGQSPLAIRPWRTPATRPWRARRQSKNRSSYRSIRTGLPQYESHAHMTPRNFPPLPCQCTHQQRTLNQSLVLKMVKARRQAGFPT